MNGPSAAEALPTGTVTFLFTDIEGSTRLLRALGDRYPAVLAEHRDLIGTAGRAHRGHVFGSEGDALFLAFPDASSAVLAAADARQALEHHAWPDSRNLRVRMGIHSGEVTLQDGDYVGLALHQVARIAAAGHGGQILVSASTKALLGGSLPPELGLRDLGEHRLKDLEHPEHLYQLTGPGPVTDFPALRTLAGPHNLPVQLTSFVGRAELDEARRLLRTSRLLTLTGPGGTGKTRLALQTAAGMLDAFPDGVTFVPLDAIVDPDLVPSAIVDALGIDPGMEPPLTSLVGYLRERQALIVLDNFEQVVDAAGVVGQLLREAPRLTILVTSRILLHTYGEQELPVPPLRLPEPGVVTTAAQASTVEAVALFVERALASQPSFQLTDANAAAVADIVIRLDGLPLAIELAAARVRILPIEALRSRLGERLKVLAGGPRDLPARQQTLRGAIDWSHELLSDADRMLFRRAGVFAGGGSLEQFEAVCGPPSEIGQDVLDGLASLTEKSLLRSIARDDEPRFGMLATIREYALERLDQSGEAAVIGRRHALTYLALAEAGAGELTGPLSRQWLDRLELDHDNLRAALEWAVDVGDAGLSLRLLAGQWRFWQLGGHLEEAHIQAGRVLAMSGVEEQPAKLRAQGLGAAGSIAYWRGEYDEVRRLYLAALDQAREADDPATLAEALYNAAYAAPPEQSDAAGFAVASELVTEALELYRQLGDQRGIANASWALGLSAVAQRDWEGGRGYVEDSLRMHRALQSSFGMRWALHELALIGLMTGDVAAADESAAEALRLFRDAGDLSGATFALLDLAEGARRTGDLERAWRLLGAADAMRRRTGTDLALVAPWQEMPVPGRPIDDPAADRAWLEGAAMAPATAIGYALGEPTVRSD